MYVDVVEEDGVTYVESSKGRIAFRNDGIVFNSKIKEPIPGLLIIKSKIMPYNGTPSPRKIVHGLEHILIGFDDKTEPIYGVEIGGNYYITKDFGNYWDGFNRFTPTEILEMARNNGIRTKYNTIKINGKTIQGFPNEEGFSWFIYGDRKRVVNLRIPFDVLDEKNEFTGDDVNQYVEEVIAELPEVFQENIAKISISKDRVRYTMKDGKDFTFYVDGRITYDWRDVEVEDIEKIIKNSIEFIDFRDFVEASDGGLPGGDGDDVFGTIGKLLKKYPYFGDDYAVPSKNLIVTKRGYIRVKNFDFVEKSIMNLAAWVLGIHNDYKVSDKVLVKVILEGKDSRARIYGKEQPMVQRIGKHYYWYSIDRGMYIGQGGFDYSNEYWGVIKYNKRKLVIGRNVKLSKTTVEKLNRGEKITINDVVPGFPASGKIEDGHYHVGNKTGDFKFFDYRLGIRVKIPYKEGLYSVYIPYDEPFDAWSPVSVKSIPEENIVENSLYIGFSNEIPDDASILYVEGVYTIKWDDNYIIVKSPCERRAQLEMKIGDRKVTVKGKGIVQSVLSANSVDGAFFVALMS